MASLAV